MDSIVYGNNLSLSANISQGLRTSLGTFAIFFGFFTRGGFLLGLVFLDATELVDKAHFTSEEGVALGADVSREIGLGRASVELGTARTGHDDLIVLWMDSRLHRCVLYQLIEFR